MQNNQVSYIVREEEENFISFGQDITDENNENNDSEIFSTKEPVCLDEFVWSKGKMCIMEYYGISCKWAELFLIKENERNTSFYCNSCDTTRPNRCYCKDRDWSDKFVKHSHRITDFGDLEIVEFVFNKMKENYEIIQNLNRNEIVLWIEESCKDHPKIKDLEYNDEYY